MVQRVVKSVTAGLSNYRGPSINRQFGCVAQQYSPYIHGGTYWPKAEKNGHCPVWSGCKKQVLPWNLPQNWWLTDDRASPVIRDQEELVVVRQYPTSRKELLTSVIYSSSLQEWDDPYEKEEKNTKKTKTSSGTYISYACKYLPLEQPSNQYPAAALLEEKDPMGVSMGKPVRRNACIPCTKGSIARSLARRINQASKQSSALLCWYLRGKPGHRRQNCFG